jgi:SAM-dependent methyltransferase
MVDESLQQQLNINIEKIYDELISVSGRIILPSLPSLIDLNMERLEGIFKAINQPFKPEELQQLREAILPTAYKAFQQSCHGKVVIDFTPNDPPEKGLSCSISALNSSIADHYQEWITYRESPLFGPHPDAKVMAIASQFSEPLNTPILDVGAGTGRNSFPLAKKGYPVDVLEVTPVFVEQLEEMSKTQNIPLNITQGDILDPLIRMRSAYYQLAIASEVVSSHLRNNNEVRLFLAKLCDMVKSGGFILFNAFLAEDTYEPDSKIKELSEVCWSYIMTKKELEEAMEGLPMQLISNESVYEYEKEHLPEEAFPPTSWFIQWAKGKNLFPHLDESLMELRWLLFQRN